MKLGSRWSVVCVFGTGALWLLSVGLVVGQAPNRPTPGMVQPTKPRPPETEQNQMRSETAFINIQTLKGIPADEFMGTMGIFSAATGLNCFDCHVDTNTPEGFAIDTPRKQIARRMATMMQDINKQYFGGRQVVTCFTCHRGSNHPQATSSIVTLYSPVVSEELDVVIPPAPAGTPTAVQILDKYLAAIGGAQRAATVTSIAAKGTYTGFGPENFPRTFELYAKAPNQKMSAIRDPESGDTNTVFDGMRGWISQPFKNIDVMSLHGAEIDSYRADAELTFPSQIKTSLAGLRSSQDYIDGKSLFSVQGTKGMAIVTMYFDQETGLMTRLVRSTPSPVGRIVVRTDIAGYKEVNGVKIPSQWTSSWFDGRSNFEITDIQVNVPSDAARFAKPGPPKPYPAAAAGGRGR